LLEVDPGSIANWIDRGLLRAYRTPGRHRRVAVEDLLEFLRVHHMPIPPELQTGCPRVLVVDDEPAAADSIARAIRDHLDNVEVVEAHDGFRAGTLIATLRPEVVVLDMVMPGLDGLMICQAIKSSSATAHAAVIAITGPIENDGQMRIIEHGARACLPKPLDLTKLVAEVAKAIGR
jgi:excisionase family DNA binding protein